MKFGNLAGSRRKKIGVLLNTQSIFPSSVLNLTENPLGSLAASGLPLSPPTVENRAVIGQLVPGTLNIFAHVNSGIGWVNLK